MDDLSSDGGFSGEPSASPPPPPPPMSGAHTYVPGVPVPDIPTNISTVSTVAQAAVGFVGLISLASVGVNLTYAGEVDELADGGSSFERIENLENQLGAIGALYLLGIAVAAIAYLLWQSRVRRAADAFGAASFRHSRRMAVGSWFIPFANLVIPKKVTDDLWRATDEDAPRHFSITGRPVAGLVSWWYALWLIGNATNRSFGSSNSLESIASASRVEAVGDVLTVAAAGLAIVMIRRLTARIRARAGRWGMPIG